MNIAKLAKIVKKMVAMITAVLTMAGYTITKLEPWQKKADHAYSYTYDYLVPVYNNDKVKIGSTRYTYEYIYLNSDEAKVYFELIKQLNYDVTKKYNNNDNLFKLELIELIKESFSVVNTAFGVINTVYNITAMIPNMYVQEAVDITLTIAPDLLPHFIGSFFSDTITKQDVLDVATLQQKLQQCISDSTGTNLDPNNLKSGLKITRYDAYDMYGHKVASPVSVENYDWKAGTTKVLEGTKNTNGTWKEVVLDESISSPYSITEKDLRTVKLSLSEDLFSIDANSHSTTVKVYTNGDSWDAKLEDQKNAGWVKFTKKGNTIEISVLQNNTGNDRWAMLVVNAKRSSGESEKSEFYVYQSRYGGSGGKF